MRALGWRLDSLPRIARGEGSYLYDTTGRRYLDRSGGPSAFSIGHGNPEVNAAIASHLAQVACGYRYLFSREPLEELTPLLLKKCGADFEPIRRKRFQRLRPP
jgi:4-aminobutyrate aminotransferase-like enzyme